jgi:hypothetical protein
MKYSHQVQVQEVQGFLEFLVFQVTQEIRRLQVGLVIQEPQGHPEPNTVVTLQIDLAFFFFTVVANMCKKNSIKPTALLHSAGLTQQ